ncbi:MAG: histidine phosphatase family protein [Acidimicrobiia bacterium]|nr:histidine phosphatase family protein [Acidimicrobiia bacterium]
MTERARFELVLVRHAEPEWARNGFNVDNPPLTERGQRQARLLAERLAGERFDEILVSPLVRTRQTAAPVLGRLGAPEAIAPWLEEIRNPIWHGTPVEKAEAAYRADRARASHERWEGLPGGERVSDFVARIREASGLFLEERGVKPLAGPLPVWSRPEPGPTGRILVVAHAGTNGVLICNLLGLEPVPWEWERFVLNHASITRLEAIELGDGITFSLTRLSDVEHLPGELRTR